MLRAVSKAGKWAVILCGFAAAVTCLFAFGVWSSGEKRTLRSAALGEQRHYTVYNSTAGVAEVILVLDGEGMRHGLATAMQARIWAFLHGSSAPVVVAIDSQGTRDSDLRNAKSQPASWRPTINGRAEKFDRFLLDELIPQFDGSSEFYLFGHSLAGLYIVDFAIRHHANRRLVGFAAFTPTISHDMSVLGRISGLCDSGTPVLMTIGSESGREHQLFDRAEATLRNAPACAKGTVKLASHPGMIHQIAMLTGQAQAIRSIVLE